MWAVWSEQVGLVVKHGDVTELRRRDLTGVHIRVATEPHAPFVRVKAAARGEVLPPGQLVDGYLLT